MEKLLTRTEFREGCLKRDNNKCVVCGATEDLSVHHIIERRLWQAEHEFGGYFLSNGASLCETHHIKAETTVLTCDEIRQKCGINSILIPEHFYADNEYDKWGNIILPNGNRLKGELFYDESVQKILEKGNVLDLFVKYVKYPRTYHLPWSHLLKDDRMLDNTNCFEGKRVVVTLKMDGENTSWYNDYMHARSINSGSHESRSWVKNLWAQKSYMLDENMRICGENLYAKHSIGYENLGSYFKMFSIWIDNDCLSWQETEEYAQILGLDLVPVIYNDVFDEAKIKAAFKQYEGNHEGYVVRLEDGFKYQDFRRSIAKFVLPEFRQIVNNSHGHWISKKVEKNGL